jgi:dTDP-4-dehydrorhamnose 3,5-epimerase
MPDDQRLPVTALRRAGNVEARAFGIAGPLLVSVRRFEDPRGVFVETYNRRDFTSVGIAEDFVQDNASVSTHVGTVRGLHFQRHPQAQAKLVRVTRGRVLDVAVDLRAGSPTFGRHIAAELSTENGHMLYVPAGFAHGFVTREPMTEVAYKVSALYAPDCDGGVFWADPDLGITWGVAPEAATLSEKDLRLPRLAELGAVF